MRTAISLLALSVLTLQAEMKSEFIYETAPFPSCHAVTLVETKPGELMAAWFGGTAEGKPDVAIWGARRQGGKWSEPVELVREKDIPTFNPVLFFSSGKLWLYYKFGPKPDNWSGARISSSDLGKSWSEADYLPAGLLGPIKNKPLVLPNGTIVSGTSVESYRTWACWVDRSTDGGKTWSHFGPITVPGARSAGTRPSGVIQPAVVKLPNGTLRIYMRSTLDIGKICYADSKDEGRTWTQAKPTNLPNPNSGIDAVSLKDGRIILVYNNTPKGRSPLNMAVSRDGENWNNFLVLESEPGEFSYPAVIQTSDGAVHAAYTWNRKKMRHVEVPLADIPK